TFAGKIAIEVELAAPTEVIWLNGDDLHVESASIRGFGRVSVVSAPPRFIGLRPVSSLGPGTVHLEISYSGLVGNDDSNGFFSVKSGGDRYGFTQFQPEGARRVFPCFDEPSFKATWKLALHVPRDVVAVSNTAAGAPDLDDRGQRVYRFER